MSQASFVDRIQDLEHRNQVLARDLAHARARAGQLAKQQAEAEETITSLRLALRKAIRAVPSGS
ncbi:hypothetical protein ACWD3Z_33215 [Streptomyces sp. NPDC002740]